MSKYASFISTGFMLAHVFSPSHAEITFDGSVGKAGALPGPDYLIDADRGALQGNNLFHSFGRFNINSGESATFAGPDQVANIIGRVTGGSFSSIDGALNSTIPNANLYLLNPNGFMFGPNARLNIDGSFYLSSADYLRFADGQRFETGTSTPPLLSIAPPEAFGFLGNQFGNIIINGSQLSVPVGKDLSLVGGDIGIQSQDVTNPGSLIMPRGYLQIASAASAGKVMQSNVMNNTLTQFGDVIIQNELINATEQPGGGVIIRGGRFFMSYAAIQSG